MKPMEIMEENNKISISRLLEIDEIQYLIYSYLKYYKRTYFMGLPQDTGCDKRGIFEMGLTCKTNFKLLRNKYGLLR